MSEDVKGRGTKGRASKLGISTARLERLVADAKKGDVASFQQLYEIFGERILNYVNRLTGSREDAEDLTQETFILAFRKLGTLKENSKIQSWLYRIAQNNVFQKYRSKGPPLESLDIEIRDQEETRQVVDSGKNPEESALSHELEDVVERVIQSLPIKYREVFVLSAIQKMSYQDISDIVNRSLASVKSDIHRARVVVRDQIKEYMGEKFGMSSTP